ncbi:MAG: hypothetical protein ACRDC2_08595 [Plesiomonas shigelloides]
MNMKLILRASVISILSLSSLANAGLSDAPVVFKSGEWSVLRTTNQMTDEVSCTGVYKNEYGIQLTGDALYISIRGGLKGITLRFGDQPAESLRLATDIEKQVDAIMIQDNDFTKLMGSNRLRVQVLTVLGNLKNYDIDLSGISAAVENIRSGCLGNPINKSLSNKPSLCSEKVLKRLLSKNVDASIINYACSGD